MISLVTLLTLNMPTKAMCVGPMRAVLISVIQGSTQTNKMQIKQTVNKGKLRAIKDKIRTQSDDETSRMDSESDERPTHNWLVTVIQ